MTTDAGAGLPEVELTDEEQRLLLRGLHEWLGPARPTAGLADLLGVDLADFTAQCKRLYADIEAGRPLAARDWAWALAVTEIAFASDVFGTGIHWSVTTGMQDDLTVKVLRSLQRKLRRYARRLDFSARP